MKLFLGIISLLVLSLGVYIYADIARQPASVVLTTTAPELDDETSIIATVTRTKAGYEPHELVVEKGTHVIFKNDSNGFHWPASDYHPTHELYPDFDAKRALGPGEEWRFQFNEPGEWTYHDHVKSSIGGIIFVEDPEEKAFTPEEDQFIEDQ